jgi:hypothetical protein
MEAVFSIPRSTEGCKQARDGIFLFSLLTLKKHRTLIERSYGTFSIYAVID